jgi:DNA repair protein RAD16
VKELKSFDVVLTTYAVLESSYRKQHSGFKRKGQMVKETSPLHALKWARIIVSIALPSLQVQIWKRDGSEPNQISTW